ncbi:MAG: hypothetical protein VYD07_00135 [Pseudomonadota bacterium]|nr:hypothetical protein [Pseudomonadota bacterium]
MSEWVTHSFRLRLGVKKPSRKQLLGIIAQWNYPFCGIAFFMQQWWLSMSQQPGADPLFCLRADWQQTASCGWIIADTQPARLVVWQSGRLVAIEQGDVAGLMRRVVEWREQHKDLTSPSVWCWYSQQPAPEAWIGDKRSDMYRSDTFLQLLPGEQLTRRSETAIKIGVGSLGLLLILLGGMYYVLNYPTTEAIETEERAFFQLDSVSAIAEIASLMSHPFAAKQHLVQIDLSGTTLRLLWQLPDQLTGSQQSKTQVETRILPSKKREGTAPTGGAADALWAAYQTTFYDAQVTQLSATQWRLAYSMMSYRHLQRLADWLVSHPQFVLSSLSMRYQHGYWSVQWTLDSQMAELI